MPDSPDVAAGELVLKTPPDFLCFESFSAFIAAMPSIFGVAVPSSITNVIVSTSQPTDSQTAALWFRRNNAGVFLGIYVFSGGQWVAILPAPGQIFWLSSNDGSVPPGFEKVSGSTAGLPPTLAPALEAMYIQDPTNTFDIYFAAVFVGL